MISDIQPLPFTEQVDPVLPEPNPAFLSRLEMHFFSNLQDYLFLSQTNNHMEFRPDIGHLFDFS
jgi:hypothetical protein